VVAGKDQDKYRDIMAETVFTGKEIEKFSDKESSAFFAHSDTIFPGFA
jgi:hypothetical protein